MSYQELQRRRQEMREAKEEAKKVGSALTSLDLTEGVRSLASAEENSNQFRYVLDDKITLARQKSAMFPILEHDVEASQVSVFNESVHSKFPLRGLRFKNTTGQPLTQGPITVYESGGYAGDSRIMDLQPGEERLLSFAVDLGAEVKAQHAGLPQELVAVKIVKGDIVASNKSRDTTMYFAANRSPQARTLLIEHPIRPEWKLTLPEKPFESSRDVNRFRLAVPAGETVKLEVQEERVQVTISAIASVSKESVQAYLGHAVTSPAVKVALEKSLALHHRVADAERDLSDEEGTLKALTDDQARLRANLKEMPATAAAYKRYLDKFDKQESEIERLQEHIKELAQEVKRRLKEKEDYVSNLSVE